MAKQLDEKTQGLVDKATATGVKNGTKSAETQIKAELERVKQSDLSKPEKKAATDALKTALANVKAAANKSE